MSMCIFTVKREDCGDNHHHHNHHSHDHIHTHEHHDHEDYGHTHTHEHHDHEDHSHTHTHEHHDHEAHGHMHTHEHHHHSGLGDIYRLIETMAVSDTVKEDAKAVYRLIAEAESKVHGKTMEQIHFHEVGTLDAVADVVGNCILMEKNRSRQNHRFSGSCGPRQCEMRSRHPAGACACHGIGFGRNSDLQRASQRRALYADRRGASEILRGLF